MWATDFQIRFYFSGPAPRLSERRTLILGLPSFPHWYADFYGLFGGAEIFALSYVILFQTSKQLFRANCILFIRLRTNIKAGIFPFKFSIFFEKRRFWRAMPGGHQRVVPTAPGSLFPKKKEEKKEEKKGRKGKREQMLCWKNSKFSKFSNISGN